MAQAKKRILWADDEISLLRPFVIMLEKMGYEVMTHTNGPDAIEALLAEGADLVILDENMPGMNGLDVLSQMKSLVPEVPVMMMTKSEAIDTMQTAYGRQIDGYLVKPVNMVQFQAGITGLLSRQDLVSENVRMRYVQEYAGMMDSVSRANTFAEWAAAYKNIVDWELRLEANEEMQSMHLELKNEANRGFAKFVCANYQDWIAHPDRPNVPLMSHRIMSERIKPMLKNGERVALVVIDNFRLDQWETVRRLIGDEFRVSTDLYCGILPSATQYARNSIFSGLLPADIKKYLPNYWVDDDANEDSLNQYERELLANYFERQRMTDIKTAYYKVGNNESGENIIKKFGGYTHNNLNALVYNFVDMLSHSATESRTLKDLLPDDAAYRSLTRSWFVHGNLRQMLFLLRDKGYTTILTTDHGTIRVSQPVDVKGPRELNSNLRFKTGKSMTYKPNEVFAIERPAEVGLPTSALSSSYIFTKGNQFFVYPNNRNEFVRYYTDTFQHGGISMEELILPIVTLRSK